MFSRAVSLGEDNLSKQQLTESPSPNVTNASHAQITLKKYSPDEYYPSKLISDNLPGPLKPLVDIFQYVWPLLCPGDSKCSRMFSPISAILNSPIPANREKSKGPQPPRYSNTWTDEPTHVAKLIANVSDIRDERFVVHSALLPTSDAKAREAERRKAEGHDGIHGWVDSRVDTLLDTPLEQDDSDTKSLNAGRNVYSIDCEMCRTEGDIAELTRISVVDWDRNVVMDELVKPDKPITNYLTQFSGMTKKKLDPITTRLEDIQQKLLDLLTPQTILVGHSLQADLEAVKMTHPYLIDTTLLYPHPKGPPIRSSLKFLAQKYLSREIQKGASGHDSIEDARAALDLVRLKCQRGAQWGTSEANEESIFKRLKRSHHPGDTENPAHNGAVVDWGFPLRGYGSVADVCVECKNDFDVVKGVCQAANNQLDKPSGPAGANFIWGRMRGLEAYRGWWNKTSTPDNEELREKARAHFKASEDSLHDPTGNSTSKDARLGIAVTETVSHIKSIYESLPPCTGFMVYSGTGDPMEYRRLVEIQSQYRKEFLVKKWDELSVHWTDAEEQGKKAACNKARNGIGFVTIK